MKKILLTLLFITIAFAVFGQATILYKDDFTLLYDAPAPYPDLLAGESVVYRIYLWDMADGAPTSTPGPSWNYYAETAVLSQFVVTPPAPRIAWCVGVQTIIIRADLVEVPSGFAYTMNPADIDPAGEPGVPFTYALDSEVVTPGKVLNLRDSGT